MNVSFGTSDQKSEVGVVQRVVTSLDSMDQRNKVKFKNSKLSHPLSWKARGVRSGAQFCHSLAEDLRLSHPKSPWVSAL